MACRSRLILGLVSLCVVAALSFLCAQQDWPAYGNDPGGARYSPLRQINNANVAQLQRAWTYHTRQEGDAGEAPPHGDQGACQNCHKDARRGTPLFEATPIVADGMMYLPTVYKRVVALEPESGHEVWKTSLNHPLYSRGVAYWRGDTNTGARVFIGTNDGWLVALDAKTGVPAAGFADKGELDLKVGVSNAPGMYAVTSPPVIYKDLVITGSRVPEGQSKGPAGDVRAWDAKTGKMVWRFHSVPQPGEANHETWPGESWKDRTGVNVWTIFTVDMERGIVYLPFGQAANDGYGADRKGPNLYADSLVALEAGTGKLIWYRQFVHHDLWDYDLPAAPALIDISRDGRKIPAVAQITKMGFLYILDRRDGKPIFPIEERPVPQSTVPGEETSPTQPFPTKPAPLSRQSFAPAEIAKVTPEHQKYCQDMLDQIKVLPSGSFTPPSTEITLYFPGMIGGSNWNGVSFDPQLGYIFANTFEEGAVVQMVKQADGARAAYSRQTPLGGRRFWDDDKFWPCQAPPWGLLTAINASTGEVAWRVPLGIIEELEAKGVHNTGTMNLGGTITTAGGLVFVAATNDSRIRAFASKTGKELWVTKIDASAHATPMTYQGKDGKQYLVIATGGTGYFNRSVADTVIAFSLPAEP